MLNIFMDSTLAIGKYGDSFIEYPNKRFNRVKRPEWFRDPFVKEIISTIDKADVVLDEALRSRLTGGGYSTEKLCGGTKTLILMYYMRNNVVLAAMGPNCTDFVERIALDYEKEGKELTIVSNYLHKYSFKYIDAIKYLNWDIICRSRMDIDKKITDLWYDHWAIKDTDDDDDEY